MDKCGALLYCRLSYPEVFQISLCLTFTNCKVVDNLYVFINTITNQLNNTSRNFLVFLLHAIATFTYRANLVFQCKYSQKWNPCKMFTVRKHFLASKGYGPWRCSRFFLTKLAVPQTVWVKVRGHCHCVPRSANSSLVSRQSHRGQHSWDEGRTGTCSTPRLFWRSL